LKNKKGLLWHETEVKGDTLEEAKAESAKEDLRAKVPPPPTDNERKKHLGAITEET